MANRYLKQPTYAFEQSTVRINGRFVVGSTGAVTSGTVKGGGVLSVVRNGTGDYTVTLADKYNKLMSFKAWLVSASGNSGIAEAELYNATPANFQSDFVTNNAFSFKTLNYAGSAADPTSGAYLYFEVIARNSNVDPFSF